MSTELNILKVAILNEQQGYRFYVDSAAKVNDDGVKTAFMQLAQDEKDHERILRGMFESLRKEHRSLRFCPDMRRPVGIPPDPHLRPVRRYEHPIRRLRRRHHGDQNTRNNGEPNDRTEHCRRFGGWTDEANLVARPAIMMVPRPATTPSPTACHPGRLPRTRSGDAQRRPGICFSEVLEFRSLGVATRVHLPPPVPLLPPRLPPPSSRLPPPVSLLPPPVSHPRTPGLFPHPRTLGPPDLVPHPAPYLRSASAANAARSSKPYSMTRSSTGKLSCR